MCHDRQASLKAGCRALIEEAEAARAFDTRAAELGGPTNFDLNGVEIDYSA